MQPIYRLLAWQMEQNVSSDISKWDDQCMQAFIKENAAVFRVFALRYISDPDAADDLLQEAYMKFWLRRNTIGVVNSPRNYFFSVLKNLISDRRNIYARQAGESLEQHDTDMPDEGNFLLNILEAESSALIARAVMQLSPQSRKVILMTLEERQMQEIAETLGITVNTVKTIKYRALKRLSELLSREDFFILLLLCYFSVR